MFKDIRTYIILGLSFVVIIFILRSCSRPSEQKEADRKQQYETEIAILKAEKTSIQARQDSLVKTVGNTRRKDSIQIAGQEIRIQALKSKLASQRPKVIEKIQADSAILTYVNTLEETVTELQTHADTLKSVIEFQRKLNEQLIFDEMTEDRIEASMQIETTRRISDLERTIKKKERGKRFAKLLVPVVAVAGFLLGTQL